MRYSFIFAIFWTRTSSFSESCSTSQVRVGKRDGIGSSGCGRLFRFPRWPEGPLGEVTLMEGLRWKRKLSVWRVNSFLTGPGVSSFGFEEKKGRDGAMLL